MNVVQKSKMSKEYVMQTNGTIIRRLPDLQQINPNSYEFKRAYEKTEVDYDTENIFD